MDHVGTGVSSVTVGTPRDQQTAEDESTNPFLSSVAMLEEFIFAMATWLGAHKVILPKIEYLIAGSFSVDSKSPRLVDGKDGPSSYEYPKFMIGSEMKESNDSFEVLYKDLVDKGCFNGKLSNLGLCWKFGL